MSNECNNDMKKCYLYLRVSSLTQDYERQRRDLENYAKAYEWEIVDTFQDKMTGKEDERPDFLRLQNIIENPNNEVKTIFCWECSRLSRRISKLSMLIDNWSKKKINVFFYKEHCWLLDPDTLEIDSRSHAFLCVITSFAQIEIEGMRERIESSRKNYIANNQTFNAKPGFGYVRNKATKRLEINESEAIIIRKIYNEIANGNSLTSTEKKYMLKYPKMNGLRTFFKRMTETKYIGKFVIKNGVIQVPAIVSEDLYNAAIKTIRNNETRDRDKPSKTYRLLQGIVRCNECGKNLYVKDYYACPSQALCLPHKCNSAQASGNIVDSIVIEFCKTKEFQSILDKRYKRIINTERKNIDSIVLENESKISLYTNQIITIRKKINRLRLFFADADTDDLEAMQKYDIKKKKLENEIQALNNEIAKLKTQNERFKLQNLNALKEDIFNMKYPSKELYDTIHKWFSVAYLIHPEGKSKFNYNLVLSSDFLSGNMVEYKGEETFHLFSNQDTPDSFTLTFNTANKKGGSRIMNVSVYAYHSLWKVGTEDNPRPACEMRFSFDIEKQYTRTGAKHRNNKL